MRAKGVGSGSRLAASLAVYSTLARHNIGYATAIAALSISYSAFIAEIFRAGIEAGALRPGLDAPARGLLREALRVHGKRQIDALHRLVSMLILRAEIEIEIVI